MESVLYLIPCTLGDTPIEQVLPPYNVEVIRQIRHFIVEEVRTARRFLRRVDREFPIDDCVFYEMGKRASSEHKAKISSALSSREGGRPQVKHADEHRFASYLEPIADGLPVGVISEAGCPAVADPGADVVAIAQRRGIRVIPLVGPNSMVLAVMASGLNGQSFAFNGYLPIDEGERARRLQVLEKRSLHEHQTQLFIETPYRNRRLYDTLLRTLSAKTRLCIAAGITTEEEWIRTHTIAEWRKQELPDLSKVPAIFLFLA
ncbi:MAG: SAM-dependent methyltransferase [Bacteroidaceae bacterium]|nr:SAM-dependent methyltransferase [Bacteroidaceae bacterium]